MKVLFVGGTGIISSACTAVALDRGIDLTLLNRGVTTRPVPVGARVITADIRDPDSVRRALGSERFDVVVNWIAFVPEHIETDLSLFRDRTDQYVFISSASAYQTPPVRLPVTEETPLENPFWPYSQHKIACEERLMRAFGDDGFPVTIVRPSHTYDQTLLPFSGRYTVVHRMRTGKPVVIHGDGTSLWTLTHHRDFAVGLVGLLGHPQALGEAVQITSDEVLTWNQIAGLVANAAGADPTIVHIPSALIAAHDRVWGEGLLGDKSHSMVFDNSKIKGLVPDFGCRIPFAEGAREILAWHDADPARRPVDPELDARMDRIVEHYQRAWPEGRAGP